MKKITNIHFMLGLITFMSSSPLVHAADTLDKYTLVVGQELRNPPILNSGSTLIASKNNIMLLKGKKTEIWSYNHSFQNPLIEIKGNEAFNIKFINQLPDATTIHWHGLAVPPDQDGNPMDPILPNQIKIFNFSIPIQHAGTYWYHPHSDQNTSEQVFRGLAGALIVRDPNDSIPPEMTERILFISDLRLTSEGLIPPNTMEDWMDGREGNYVLINGQLEPKITMKDGESQRWRIINATNARYLRLALKNNFFTLIGTDGGLISSPQFNLKEILLAPAERIEVIVTANAKNAKPSILQVFPYKRGKMMGKEQTRTLNIATVQYSGVQKPTPRKLPIKLREIEILKEAKVNRRFVLSENMKMTNDKHGMNFLINGKKFDMNRIDIKANAGMIEQWEIMNDTDMDHPFHVHGTQFQIVEFEYNKKITKLPYIAWKDTVNIRPGETVKIRIKQDFRGKRMYHCHILEHEDLGMMGLLEVS